MNKKILNIVGSLLIIALLGTFGLMFVNGYAFNGLPTQADFPSFNTITPTPMTCSSPTEWVSYSDTVVGYTLKYPSESKLVESNDLSRVTIVLQPQCYDWRCPQTTSMEIEILANPSQLQAKEFIETDLTRSEESAVASAEFDVLENGGRYVTVAGVEGIRIDDGEGHHSEIVKIAGRDKPIVFIPHGNNMMKISVNAAGKGMMPPFDPPCNGTLKIFDEILESLQLQ